MPNAYSLMQGQEVTIRSRCCRYAGYWRARRAERL